MNNSDKRNKTNEIIMYDDYAEIIIISPKYGEIKEKIDIKNIEKVKQFYWVISKAHCPRLKCTIYYAQCTGKDHYLLHRFIMNCPKGLVVDHINGDTLDNRESNLRICTIQQNNMNRRTFDINTSGHRGVYHLDKGYINKWRASIKIKGRLKSIGHYFTYEEAVKARLDAEKLYYGDYARQND